MDRSLTIACPVCAATTVSVTQERPVDFEYGVIPLRAFRQIRCQDCGSEFLWPRPTASELPHYYPPHYHAYNEDHGPVAAALVTARSYMRARFYNRLLDHRPGRVFDVGAGDCRHFEGLKRHCRLEFAGVEINPSVAHEARSRGYDVATGTLEELDIGAQRCQFDIVSMYHLIEHVVDPVLVFRKAFDLLRPGGYVLGQTPAIDSWERRLFGVAWGGYHFPRHLEVFSRHGLRRCIAKAGFYKVTVRSAPHLQCAISVQNSLIRAGWRPRLVYGKSSLYSLFLVAVMPFEAAAWIAGRSGVINFMAQKAMTSFSAHNTHSIMTRGRPPAPPVEDAAPPAPPPPAQRCADDKEGRYMPKPLLSE